MHRGGAVNWLPDKGNRQRLWWYGGGLLVALLLASFAKGYWQSPGAVPGYQVAKAAIAVSGMKKQEIKAKTVKALPKREASKKLDLPPDVTDDDQQEIIDTAEIPPAPRGATTVTVLDTVTGDSKTLVKIKPRPLVEILTGTAVGLRYGLTSKGTQAVDAYIRRDLLRIGHVHLAAYGEVRSTITNPEPEARGMLDVSLRW